MTASKVRLGSTRRPSGEVVSAAPAVLARALVAGLVALAAWWVLAPAIARAGGRPFLNGQTPTTIATTQPSNLDQNPYGIVRVPRSVGDLRRGELLVSNFNNGANTQGTGTTIVQIPSRGNSQMGGRRTCSPRSIPRSSGFRARVASV